MFTLLAQVGTGELKLPSVEYSAIIPELLLSGGALFMLLIASVVKSRIPQYVYSAYTVIIGVASIAAALLTWSNIKDRGVFSAFSGSIADDHYSQFFVVTIATGLVLATLVNGDWLHRRNTRGPELHVLSMLAAAGGMFMAAANDLIVVFLGLEILSIALYVLAGFNRRSDRSREAALKYLLLGGFSSAVFLYGIALVYGATGSTNLSSIATFLANNLLVDRGLLLAGMGLLAVGFAFKVAAVPFHQWTPDVYEGSPTPITGLMAAVAKAAAFAAFIRIFVGTLASMQFDWKPILLVLAVLTLLVGSVVACVQTNVKRMLAYSSISHAGYVLLGLHAATTEGVSGALYYLLAYTFMVVGSFAIVSCVAGRNDDHHGLDAYRGLGKRNPVIALAFTILLIAQLGMPLTSGFLAKFNVIAAQVQNGSYATAVFAMLMAAIAAFFYLRIVIAMWTGLLSGDGSPVSRPSLKMPPATWLATVLAVGFTVLLGVFPDFLDAISFAREAAADLFQTASPGGPGGLGG